MLSLDLTTCKRSQKGHYCRGLADILQHTTFDISHGNRPPAWLSRPWNPELKTASTSDFWKNIHHMSLNATTFENCSSPTCEMSSNKSDATLDQLKTSANTPAPEGDDDAPPEEPAMTAWAWVCWTLDLAWCLTILSPNIAHIVLWTAIMLGVPTRKGGKLADWFQLAVWTLVLTFCPSVQAAQAGALKHPFGSESREAFIDLSAPQVGHKLPLWPIKAAEMRLCARVKRMRRSMARSPLRLQRHLLLRRPAPLFK